MTSKSIPPFFEPGAPPPPLPLLTLQTDLSYMPHPSPTITANEELLPSDTKKVKPQIRSRAASRARSSSPYTIPPTKVKNRVRVAPATPTAPSNDDTQSERSNSEQSELTELSSTRSESPTDLDDELIRKPAGEPGRPGRGGYNLEAAVGWKGKAFEKLQKYVYDQVEKHLDITKSYLGQPENKRKIVRDAAIDVFPQLERYHDCWPVNDLIMMHLKNTSRRERLKAVKMGEAIASTDKSKKGKKSTSS